LTTETTNNFLVSVITPVYNGGELIRETIESVLGQTYSAVEYIIIDGNSSDNTLEVARSYGASIAELISEPDCGMYDALAKGLLRANGEIICYINAGDLLQPYALEVVVDIFSNPDYTWVTGCRSVCNEQGVVTHVDLPFRYKRSLIRAGSYGKTLPFIQQESTFWRASLLKTVDMDFLRSLKLAGDYYLWWSFSKHEHLEIVSSPLGIFRKHRGQLSERMNDYHSEVDTFTERRGMVALFLEIFELIVWSLHPKIRAKFKETTLRFNHESGQWGKTFDS
jgi:glycosyltransferase involved in cell wall biosynthesis